jgi:hypothetical protein
LELISKDLSKDKTLALDAWGDNNNPMAMWCMANESVSFPLGHAPYKIGGEILLFI